MKGPLSDIAATLFLLATVLLGGYLYLDWKKSQIETSKEASAMLEKGIPLEVGKSITITFEGASKTTE